MHSLFLSACYWQLSYFGTACGIISYAVHAFLQFNVQLMLNLCARIFYSSGARASNILARKQYDSSLESLNYVSHRDIGCALQRRHVQKL